MGKKGSETTTTNWMSPEDQARVRQGRRYGDAASQSARGIQEAGVDPYSRQAGGYYGDLFNDYGNIGNLAEQYGRAGLNFASRTGLSDMDQYMDPYAMSQINPMRDMFDRMRADEYSGAGQDATMQGAFGGSRHAKLAAMRLGGVDRNQAMAEGDIYARSAREAAQMLMNERGRMQGLGMGAYGIGMNALSGQGAMAGNMANMGDYYRQIQQLQNERQAKNDLMASQAQQGSYGQNIESGTTEKTEKGWMEGVLPFAMNAASMFIPGAQMAAPMMSGMMGGSGGGQSPYLNQLAQDPWQGMNMGMGGGSYGGGALFNPQPAGGFFGGINYGPGGPA